MDGEVREECDQLLSGCVAPYSAIRSEHGTLSLRAERSDFTAPSALK